MNLRDRFLSRPTKNRPPHHIIVYPVLSCAFYEPEGENEPQGTERLHCTMPFNIRQKGRYFSRDLHIAPRAQCEDYAKAIGSKAENEEEKVQMYINNNK